MCLCRIWKVAGSDPSADYLRLFSLLNTEILTFDSRPLGDNLLIKKNLTLVQVKLPVRDMKACRACRGADKSLARLGKKQATATKP